MYAGQTFYLGGPMSGIKQANFPAFDSAAACLRGLGLNIVSPAELDDPEIRDKTMRCEPTTGHTWGDFLSRDVKLIADSKLDGIIYLPGWEKSRGARLEGYVNILNSTPDKPRVFLLYPTLERVSANYVLARL